MCSAAHSPGALSQRCAAGLVQVVEHPGQARGGGVGVVVHPRHVQHDRDGAAVKLHRGEWGASAGRLGPRTGIAAAEAARIKHSAKLLPPPTCGCCRSGEASSQDAARKTTGSSCGGRWGENKSRQSAQGSAPASRARAAAARGALRLLLCEHGAVTRPAQPQPALRAAHPSPAAGAT